MKSCDGSIKRLYSSLLVPVAALVALSLSSCYTQFGSERGDYWNYTGTPQKEVAQPAPVRMDTAVTATAAPQSMALLDTVPEPASTTVINNYYYDDGWDANWWDRYRWEHYYRHRHPGVSLTIVIGDPYWVDPWHPAYYNDHRYCENWYWCDDYWYHPTYRGPGWVSWDPYYPYPPYPFYGCYAPTYYPDPYWWPHRPYWDGYGGYYGGHGYATSRPNVRTGRIGGGERRVNEPNTGGTPRIDRASEMDARNAPVNVKAPNERAGVPQGIATPPEPSRAQPEQETRRSPGEAVTPQPTRDRAPEQTRQNPDASSPTTQPAQPSQPQAPERAQPRDNTREQPQAPEPAKQEPARKSTGRQSYRQSGERARERASEPTNREPERESVQSEGRSSESTPSERSSGSERGSSRNDSSRGSGGRAR